MSQLSEHEARAIIEYIFNYYKLTENSKQIRAWSKSYYERLYDGSVVSRGRELNRLAEEIKRQKNLRREEEDREMGDGE